MTDTSSLRIPGRARTLLLALTACVSLFCNVILLGSWVRPATSREVTEAATRPQTSLAAAPRSSTNTSRAPDPETGFKPAFHWNQIESADYRQYVANLRAVGCPEQVIRDIIAADVLQLFAPRAKAIYQPGNKYWQKHQSANPEQIKQLMALGEEKKALVKGLVGVTVGDQSLVDTLCLQLYGSEEQLLFLSPEKREVALNALAEVGFDEKEMDPNRSRRDVDEMKLFDEKTKLLAGVLSSEELEAFRLRYSPQTGQLRSAMRNFNCTPEEFSSLLAALEKRNAESSRGNQFGQKEVLEAVRAQFGEARAAEFERATDINHVIASDALEALHLPVEGADQAWQIARATKQAAEQAAADSRMSVEERKQKVRRIRDEARARLVEALGQKVGLAVHDDLKVQLHSTEANIR